MKKLSLRFLTLCDYAMSSREGKISIIDIFDEISVRKIPSSFGNFFVVAVIEGQPLNEQKIELNIKDPKGKKVLPPKILKVKLSDTGRANIIARVANIQLNEIGEYILDIKNNNKVLGGTVFWVKPVETQHEREENKLPN